MTHLSIPTSNTKSSTSDESSKSCWGCIKRRWVCDCTKPACAKCSSAGIECPGYSSTKPVTWLNPGQVRSRRRPRTKVSSTDEKDGKYEVVKSGRHHAYNTPIKLVPPIVFDTHFLEALQASNYYNMEIFPDLQINQFGKNPWVIQINEMHSLPPFLRHSLISMALAHQFLRTSSSTAIPGNQLESRRAFYHAEIAIRALNQYLNVEATRMSETSLSGILSLLYLEMQQSLDPNWCAHTKAISTFIMYHGGLRELCSALPALKATMLAYVIFVVMAETTSPPATIGEGICYFEAIDMVPDLLEAGIYPAFPCPETLFLAIIDINRFRYLHANNKAIEEKSFILEVRRVIERIEGFSPASWAERAYSFNDQWCLLAQIYQIAVLLYAIACLTSANTIYAFPKLYSMRESQRNDLFQLLQEASSFPRISHSLLWPLIVAGFEAADMGSTEKSLVTEMLTEASRVAGMLTPCAAKQLLETYWHSEQRDWNACFNQPYAFVA